MSKALASDWMLLARRLADLEGDFRTKNIAICLASAYRQGWSDSRDEEVQCALIAATLLRTILAEDERTGFLDSSGGHPRAHAGDEAGGGLL